MENGKKIQFNCVIYYFSFLLACLFVFSLLLTSFCAEPSACVLFMLELCIFCLSIITIHLITICTLCHNHQSLITNKITSARTNNIPRKNSQFAYYIYFPPFPYNEICSVLYNNFRLGFPLLLFMTVLSSSSVWMFSFRARVRDPIL